MLKIKYLRNILLISLAMAIIVPMFNIFFVFPSFIATLEEESEKDAIRTATHLTSMLIKNKKLKTEEPLSIDAKIVEAVKKDLEIVNVKIFLPSGEIIYSDDHKEIGTLNKKQYFRDVVAKRLSFTKIVQKNSTSLDGQKLTVDVVEAYVPIVKNANLIGVFEIYSDITAKKEKYEKLIIRTSAFFAMIAAGFIVLVLLLSAKASKSISGRMKMEEELRRHRKYLVEIVDERTSELKLSNEQLQQEIEERKKMEHALIKASDDWRVTFDSAKDMILMLNNDFKIVKANHASTEFFKYSFKELLGQSYFELFDNFDVSQAECPLLNMQRTRVHEEGEIYLPSVKKWLMASADPILYGTNNLKGAVIILRDITEIKKMQDSILEAKNDWEESFNTINDAITIHDNEFNIIRANKTAQELLELSDLNITPLKCYEYYHGTDCPPQGCTSCPSIETGMYSVTEVYEPHINKYLEVKALPRIHKKNNIIGSIHVVRDITDRKNAEMEQRELQDQLVQAQKMQSIGRLAGGVAHDFNNVLSAVLGYSELILNKLPRDSDLREFVEIIYQSGENAAELTRQLLAFSRKQVLEMKAINIEETVTNMSRMLGRMIGEDIKIEIQTSGRTRNIMGDPVQIEQIIMNLAVNARDAMPVGGSLIIKVAEVKLDEADANMQRDIVPGIYSMLAMTDTGAGITNEVQEKMFEPFFTTKEQGKGTGLGLSTVYGIVQQHRGHIFVFSEQGKGTTFKIFFPTLDNKEDMEEEEETKDDLMPQGTEKILVIDDDPNIRKLVIDTLQPLGYKLLEAEGGEAALKIIEKKQAEIDLFLTDVIMPGMNGRDLAKNIRSKWPNAKVIYMSGYTDEILDNYGVLHESESFISKPLTPTAIAQKVRDILNG